MENVTIFWTILLALGGTAAASGCRAYHAVEGTPLVVPCNLGCFFEQPIWYNRTGGAAEEIPQDSGMISETGELTLTASASPHFGGQEYECRCGEKSACRVIHFAGEVSIALDPPAVAVGGDVTVTCVSYGAYPQHTELSLFLPGGVVTVQSGVPFVFRNVTLQDAGLWTCTLPDVTTQPSSTSNLSVYTEPEILDENSTAVVTEGETATLLCTVRTNQCRALVQFFSDGNKLEGDDGRFNPIVVSSDNGQVLHGYLIIKDVRQEDVGRHYQCVTYANYSTMIPVGSKDLFLKSSTTSESDTDLNEKECTKENNTLVVVLSVLLGVAVILGVILATALLMIVCKWRRHKCVDTTGEQLPRFYFDNI